MHTRACSGTSPDSFLSNTPGFPTNNINLICPPNYYTFGTNLTEFTPREFLFKPTKFDPFDLTMFEKIKTRKSS